ncbi:putative NBD/HSP70 family sugar kinase [Caldicoprobacter guelmensis]|uniref:ROK family transcriptional regulator n=1 Tax=Caldicoprobacter guelmensis TaxID=1170224 RepID=UPI0019583427|nr:ROK family transcriptional regulator [Caldicoprobacter guelmensis]MBM7583141.1 putative NBD/HSP70 family sugar kinase [Caldicoprobacter guelmensis]
MKSRHNLKELKEKNKKIILSLLIKKGPLSRTEISQYTGLSQTAVSDLVEELMMDHFIKEIGPGEYTGGRRPILLDFNAENGYVVGIRVAENKINSVLFDLNMGKIAEKEIAFDYFSSHNLHKILMRHILSLEKELCGDDKKILGVGICLDSNMKLLNPKAMLDTSISAEFMSLEEALTFELGIPVVKEQEINLKAIAEYRRLSGVNNLAYLEIDDNIKAGVVINGKVFEGGINLEHLIIDKDGAECPEGHRGCLISLISAKAIIKKALIMMIEEHVGITSSITDIGELNLENLSGFLNEAKISKLTNEVAGYFKIALLNLKNLLNIKAFVLGGRVLNLSGLIDRLNSGLEGVIIKKTSVKHEDILREVSRLSLKKLIDVKGG